MLRLAALAVLLVLVGGGVYLWKTNPHTAPRNLAEVKDQIKDGVLSSEVKTALTLHKRLKPYPISVSTEAGVVTLRGELPDAGLRATAERLAAAVPDVRQVVNQIKLGGSAVASKDEADERSIGERLDDEALEVQARMAFSLNKHLKDAKLEVSCWKKELRVTGEVDAVETQRLALDTLREITGAKAVTDQIRVRGGLHADGGDEPDRRAAVLRALRGNPNLSQREIAVRLDGDRVVLVGWVRNGAERDLAGLLARDALGRSVQNDLEIRPEAGVR